jgi:hypothetical protein
MTRRLLRNENLLYAAAFLLALVIRLAGLGRSPLTDSEASLALQALALSKGQETILSAQPAYLILSTVWMFLFGASQWTARFWPALTGSALVLCPALFKRQLGKIPALLLAFILVFDPAMLAVAGTAGSLALALLFVTLFAGLLLARKTALAGVAGGMALLSGPDLWPGILGIGLAVLVARWFGFFKPIASEVEAGEPARQPLFPADFAWRRLLWFLFGTLFFAGTLFFTFPRGLSAAAGGIAAYFQGWALPAHSPAELLTLALGVYEFFVLFLGIWGAINGLLRRNPMDRFVLVWGLISFILVLLYPGRDVTSIAWVVLPLAVLAARQMARILDITQDDWLPALGQAILSGLILVFISMTIIAMVNNPQFQNEREYWVRLIGALVMLVASAALIAWGWSSRVSLRGLSWGFCLLLIISMLSTSWDVAGLSSKSGLDFWKPKADLPDETLLLTTIDRINQWAPPVSGGYDIVVVGIQSPALRWSLRGHSKVKFSSQFPTGESPAILITRDQPNLPFSMAYRGEGFLLSKDTGWRLIHSDEWLRWVAFRVVPSEVLLKEKVILWARTDLFPGFDTAQAPVPVPDQSQENPK